MHASSDQFRKRKRFAAIATLVLLSSSTHAQVLHTWAAVGADWSNGANWNPAGPPGGNGVAQFAPIAGGVQPNLSGSAATRQLILGPGTSGGWSISGTGALTTGINGGFDPNPPNAPLGVLGLLSLAGSGDHTIDLGNGSTPSFSVGGLGVSSTGAIIISANSRVTLAGNTVAAIDNSLINNATSVPQIALRSGTLVLDNSAGNPAAERLTTGSSNFNMVGGGAGLELRGAAAGTVFSGLSRNVIISAGSAYIRTVQNAAGTLAVNFTNISRATARHQLFVENIGSGFAGAVGKPSVTSANAGSNFNVTQSFGGVISGSATTAVPWVMVTNRASDAPDAVVTGRWANYSGGIVASTSTLFTTDFSAAPANSNVLFTPGAGTVSLAASPASVSSVVFEPTVGGATLDLAGNSLNTRGVALSGPRDMTVVNGNLFYTDGSVGGRTVNVLNPTSSLFVSSSLADPANSSLLVGGKGFFVLTGASNQIAFAGAQSLYLNDGVMRVTSGNFVPTNTSIAFRGGTLEYDVSGGSTSINFSVAAGSGNVTWSSTSPGSAGEFQTTDVGGGGFSAFSNSPGNTLTVNLGGAGAQLDWNAPGFITTYHALKFGSLKSNATVDFQNPIGLGTATGSAYRTRNIHVTRGAGTAADKTRLNGVISGIAGYDLVKTGGGVLEITAVNTYAGNTVVREGELRVSGNNSGGGAYFVDNGATLSGTGTLSGSVLVRAGGKIRGEADGGTGDLTVGGATVAAAGRIAANLGAPVQSSAIAAGGNFINLASGAMLELNSVAGFSAASAGSWDIATLSNGANLQLNGVGVADNFVFGTFVQGAGASGAVAIDTSNLGVSLAAGDQFQLSRAGNNLVLNLTLAVGGASQWNVDADGAWSNAANWSPSTPNASGAVADFTSVISAPRTVTVDTPQTVGQINFNNANQYTIAGAASLTLDNTSGAVGVAVASGNHRITAPLVLAKDTTLDVSTGNALSLTNVQSGSVSITKQGAGTAEFNNIRANMITVAAGRAAVIANALPASAMGTSKVGTLNIAAGAQLDISNNAAIVDYSTIGTLLAETRQHVSSGRLISSMNISGTAVGYADNASLGLSSFGGLQVDSTSLLIRYTRLGDANLDGVTNISDFAILAARFNQTGAWQNGDFDHNGNINISDFSLLAANFNLGAPASLPRHSVPEAAAGALVLAGLMFGIRRRSYFMSV